MRVGRTGFAEGGRQIDEFALIGGEIGTGVESEGQRIEVRGFGSFSLHYREPRKGRNPKTGDAVELSGKYVPHFKPGKELRDRVNLGLQAGR